jgi:hypothetical protein
MCVVEEMFGNVLMDALKVTLRCGEEALFMSRRGWSVMNSRLDPPVIPYCYPYVKRMTLVDMKLQQRRLC